MRTRCWSFLEDVVISGNKMGRIAALIVLLLSWGAVGCSTTIPGASSPTPTRGVIAKRADICLGTIPNEWAAALSKTTILIPNVEWFAMEAVDDPGGVAYGSYHAGNNYGIASVDLSSGGFRVISTAPPAAWGGVLWMSVSSPWLAWAESKGHGAWALKGWNIQTGESLTIATSELLAGQYTFPVVGPDYVAWSQATSDSSADIRIYRFTSRETTVLDSGRLSPPVIAGRYLVWGKYRGGDTQPSFTTVDAGTLRSEPLPNALNGPQDIVYLAGSSEYLVWSENATTLAAADFKTATVTTYRIQQDGRHNLQFPMLATRILVWWTGVVETVLDVRTGNGFDLIDGTAAGAGDTLVISGARGKVPTLSAIHLSQSAGISSCSR